MSKHAHYVRQFLNNEEHGGLALIEAYITEVETSSHDKSKHFDASMTIGDCNRRVTLDFGVWGADSAPEIRQKIARLRRALVNFERVLLSQIEEVEAAG